jgi:hypothetical protein
MFKLLALPLICALAAPAFADDAPRPVETLKLSANVYARGIAASDPLLILAAAKLRKSVAVTEKARVPTGGETGAEDGAFVTWDAMLDRAAMLAGGDEAMLGLIEDVRDENSKGVVDGPVYSIVSITAGHQDEYDALAFEGGRYAEIYVEGKGTSDLNLYVFDDQDRLVCSDTDISDIAYCGWRPVRTAGYRIKVENKGGSGNKYSLITN